MVEAAQFYRENLGPLPFGGYECYDSERYYGIESYSHTLLQRESTHFLSHEMGHSYFGGLAPCTYVHDSWNEGVTQYVDSVLLLHDEDKSLEAGLKTVGTAAALSEMAIPWNLENASYMRGCYVMKMLESEIGSRQVLRGLRRIASERKGLDTRWADLKSYFEEEGKVKLDWFWQQWIFGSQFPKVSYTSETKASPDGSYETRFTLTQTGTSLPYRMRLELKCVGFGGEVERQIELSRETDTFSLDSPWRPTNHEVSAFPLSLATIVEK